MKQIAFSIIVLYSCILLNAQKTDVMLPSDRPREQIIHHNGFSLSYNSSYLQPSWVTYKVSKSQTDREKIKGRYKPDPQVSTRSADTKDYKQGGYIMAQFVNYLDLKHIPEATDESFYMTNITPMKLAYYNHIWLKVEELIRLWAADSEGLYVVCGAILSDAPFSTIGENNVSVPKRFYKAVYDPKNNRAIGFIFKNGMSSGSLSSYAVSIDDIEKDAEIDLFPTLNDETEITIESNTDFSDWNFELIK